MGLTPSIVIIAAMKEEVAPLVRKLEQRRPTTLGVAGVEGIMAGLGCLVVWCGVGRTAAGRTARALLDQLDGVVEHTFVVGLAGGLDPSLEPGALVEPGRVVALSGEPRGLGDGEPQHPVIRKRLQKQLRTKDLSNASGPTLVTAPALISATADKAELWESIDRARHAVVDMETYWLLEPLAQSATELHVIRSVSDTADEELPAFLATTSADGGIDRLAVVRSALVRPSSWPVLLRLQSRMKAGAEALAGRLEERLVELGGGRRERRR